MVLGNYYYLSKNHQTHATRTTFCNTRGNKIIQYSACTY